MRNEHLSICLLPLLLLAGCASESPPDDQATPTTIPPLVPVNGTGPIIAIPAGGTAWQINETLASVDCVGVTLGLQGADKAWIDNQMPEGTTVPGTAPDVNVVVIQCASQVLGNRTILSQSHSLLAYVMAERSGFADSVAFPLEFSTNNALAAAALQGWGIYAENITIQTSQTPAGTDAMSVAGTTSDYEVTFGPPFPSRIQAPPLELRVWGGSEVSLDYRMTRESDQFPSVCSAKFNSGRLAEAFPRPPTCIFAGVTASEVVLAEIIR